MKRTLLRTPADRARLATRGRVTVQLRAGEDPAQVRTLNDVARGAALPAGRLDGGPIDDVVNRFSTRKRITRAFQAAANLHNPGHGHEDFDDIERKVGMSRTFCIEVDTDTDLQGLTAGLNELEAIESASPQFLTSTPFGRGNGRPSDPHWAHRMVGAAEALAIEPGDPATLIGLVDSGVLLEHPELTGRLRAGANAVSLAAPDLPEGMVMVAAGYDRLPQDEEGHGTACAGIIGANGFQVPPGIAGACWMIPMKALSAVRPSAHEPPTAVGSLLDIDRAVKAAIDLGARVLNLSFGTPESALEPHDPVPHVAVVRYALERDCVLVAASGNSGDEVRYFPAALPGVIAVGAVDEQRRPAHFSTRGAHVALCAPGQGIPLAALDGGYSSGSGTSFAAPFVAGACALMIGRGLRRSTPLGWATLRNLLATSAGPFAASAPTGGCGGGILDLPAALRAVDEACRLPPDELFSDSQESSLARQAGAP